MSLNRKEVDQTAQEFASNPVHVWIVRDKLETAVKEADGTLTPFSKLQESMRSAANMWFGVEDYR